GRKARYASAVDSTLVNSDVASPSATRPMRPGLVSVPLAWSIEPPSSEQDIWLPCMTILIVWNTFIAAETGCEASSCCWPFTTCQGCGVWGPLSPHMMLLFTSGKRPARPTTPLLRPSIFTLALAVESPVAGPAARCDQEPDCRERTCVPSLTTLGT